MKCPSLLMDTCLDGLDWDTIPGFFNCQDAINSNDVISHNLVLALFLTLNTQRQLNRQTASLETMCSLQW